MRFISSSVLPRVLTRWLPAVIAAAIVIVTAVAVVLSVLRVAIGEEGQQKQDAVDRTGVLVTSTTAGKIAMDAPEVTPAGPLASRVRPARGRSALLNHLVLCALVLIVATGFIIQFTTITAA